MSLDKSPLDQALDLVVFAPLGLALTAKDALPDWAAKGRRRIFHQVGVAKMVGEHATRHGQKVVTGALVGLGILPGPPPSPRPTASGAHGNGAHTRAHPRADSANGRAAPTSTPTSTPTSAIVSEGPVPPSADLAIPGYDSLSASQVVQRLAGLAAAELEAVGTYEAASRGRRTILTKISQLQAGRT